MSKNVLVLSASPRRHGNSDTLCDELIRGAQEAGHQTRKVFLRDKNIGYCTGCGVCNETHRCVQSDDMGQLLEAMVQADVIVMGTPVYFYTMDGQMKTLIDRTVPRYTQMSGKEFCFVVSAAANDIPAMERTIEGFRGFTACLERPVERGVVYGVGAWGMGEVQGTPAMAQAYELGRSL